MGVLVFEGDAGVHGVLVRLNNNVTPKLRHVQHIGLVHGTNLVISLESDVEGYLGDAPYLALLIAHVVEPKTLTILLRDALGLPEIDVACQLTNNHDVDAADHLGLECGGSDQLRENCYVFCNLHIVTLY